MEGHSAQSSKSQMIRDKHFIQAEFPTRMEVPSFLCICRISRKARVYTILFPPLHEFSYTCKPSEALLFLPFRVVYVCMYVYTYIHTYIHLYIHTQTYNFLSILVRTFMLVHICMYASTRGHKLVCTHVHKRVSMSQTYAYSHAKDLHSTCTEICTCV